MSVYDQIINILTGKEGNIITPQEVKHIIQKKFGTNPESIILSDYCYNRINKGIKFDKHVFQYVNRGSYIYLGEDYPYSGLVFHKPKDSNEEYPVGEWTNGEKLLYHEYFQDSNKIMNIENITKEIRKAQIPKLYEHYNNILRLELGLLQCKPTELRHLIGRIGEFFCAIETNGVLSRVPNQQGFDVLSNGRKISVKTTAQTSGFISINKNTFHLVDDLFVVQYSNDSFNKIFYGMKEEIVDISRTYGSNYEIDISKLKNSSSK